MKKFLLWCLTLSLFLSLIACEKKAELGTAQNPIKLILVPGQDTMILEANGKKLEAWLQKQTGYVFKLTVPVSFVAVIEALGSKRADIAMMNTFGYLVAHDRYGARVRLIGLNQNSDSYHGQIIARVDGPKSLADLQGKKFAFVDPASTSGYVLAAKALQDAGVKPKEFIFAGRHDTVVTMVYQGRVDAGATFNSLPKNGQPNDARRLVIKQFPDVLEKIKILKLTGPVPNDPVVFRAGFPALMEEKVVKAFKDYFKTEEGREVMYSLYHMSGVRDASELDYQPIRKMLLEMGKSAQDFTK